MTAIWTLAGWAYLAAIVDPFARRVVGWAMGESNDTMLALDALRRAVRTRRPPRGLVHHSDRGSPHASDASGAKLYEHGMVPSMSRKGDCWDNAVAESSFATLYNVERRHSHLGSVNLVEFELRSRTVKAAAWSRCPRDRGNFIRRCDVAVTAVDPPQRAPSTSPGDMRYLNK